MNPLALPEKPAVGDVAPDLELPDETGKLVRLSQLWAERPLVLLFVRHLGCPLCREHAVSVQADHSRFEDAGADVALATMGTPEQVAAFRERYQLPFHCLSDVEGRAYRAYAVPRGRLGAVAGPAMWRRGWKALLRHGAGKVIGDPYQLPGSFVIDTTGVIRKAHRAKSSADWPPNEELIDAIAAVRPA